MRDFTRLAGAGSYGEPRASDLLEGALLSWFQWGLLELGAYRNVVIPTSGIYGGDLHRLRPVDDPRFPAGRVWQASRKDWIWETGVNHFPGPTVFSGVFVGGIFRPATGVGPYAFQTDFPGGRVIFGSSLPLTSVVTAEYAFRRVQLYRSDEEWFRTLQFDSLRADHPDLVRYASGAWHVLAQNRIQLPALVLESKPDARMEQQGRELGSLARIQHQAVVCHVLAEHPWERRQLHDILADQYQKGLYALDPAKMTAQQKFPLYPDGTRTPSSAMYPDLVDPAAPDNCSGKTVYIIRVETAEYLTAPRLYWAAARLTCEINLP